MRTTILSILCLVISLLALSAASYSWFSHKSRTGFVVTQTLFSEFKGTKDAEKLLNPKFQSAKMQLDSLEMVLKSYKGKDSTSTTYQKTVDTYMQLLNAYQADSEQETKAQEAGIWKQINEYILVYGKEKKYDYIYGTNGLGSLMYASDSKDITKEVIQFINQKYEGK